jgi:hypothetical protein
MNPYWQMKGTHWKTLPLFLEDAIIIGGCVFVGAMMLIQWRIVGEVF